MNLKELAGKKAAEYVKEGMTVVDGIVFIGKVVVVSSARSNVILPTDFEIAIPVKTSRGAKGMVLVSPAKA